MKTKKPVTKKYTVKKPKIKIKKQSTYKEDIKELLASITILELRFNDVEEISNTYRTKINDQEKAIERMKVAIAQLARQDRDQGADYAAKMRMSGTEYKLAMMEKWVDNLRVVANKKGAVLQDLLKAINLSYALRDAPTAIAAAIDHMKAQLEDARKIEAEKNAQAISKLVVSGVDPLDQEEPVEFDSPSKLNWMGLMMMPEETEER